MGRKLDGDSRERQSLLHDAVALPIVEVLRRHRRAGRGVLPVGETSFDILGELLASRCAATRRAAVSKASHIARRIIGGR